MLSLSELPWHKTVASATNVSLRMDAFERRPETNNCPFLKLFYVMKSFSAFGWASRNSAFHELPAHSQKLRHSVFWRAVLIGYILESILLWNNCQTFVIWWSISTSSKCLNMSQRCPSMSRTIPNYCNHFCELHVAALNPTLLSQPIYYVNRIAVDFIISHFEWIVSF